jgi:transposase-like protein
MGTPKTLKAAVEHFANPDNALEYFASYRWPNGVECPYCQAKEPMFLKSRRIWKCRATKCRKQFSVKVGTIFNESPIGLDKWLIGIWLISNCKNGVSSYELARDIGVSQKTAWFMLGRIRLAMQNENGGKLSGEIEADESFIGGKARNMHAKDRARRLRGRGPDSKAIVAAVLERGGRVRATARRQTAQDST